jgi:hypothetical protein
MSLLDYDFDELAQQVQQGLERIAVNFFRAHGARIKQDALDFHGLELIDLELSFGGHTLKLHQVGRPRGPSYAETALPPGAQAEEFESQFDGWPAEDAPVETIALWLASLPAGEAPRERPGAGDTTGNPFAAEQKAPPLPLDAAPTFNPFLNEAPRGRAGPNPFADSGRDARRRDALRWLQDDDQAGQL